MLHGGGASRGTSPLYLSTGQLFMTIALGSLRLESALLGNPISLKDGLTKPSPECCLATALCTEAIQVWYLAFKFQGTIGQVHQFSYVQAHCHCGWVEGSNLMKLEFLPSSIYLYKRYWGRIEPKTSGVGWILLTFWSASPLLVFPLNFCFTQWIWALFSSPSALNPQSFFPSIFLELYIFHMLLNVCDKSITYGSVKMLMWFSSPISHSEQGNWTHIWKTKPNQTYLSLLFSFVLISFTSFHRASEVGFTYLVTWLFSVHD